ncbi:GIY-YIG nuclease family protein [Isoptericola sp. NPDC019571]|uniref:GIY-YIG nuclease family protein n=1 Tax=Isoptericola sp. NPDC019571 TaxID=3364008 RepID=UPI0037B4D261
MVEVIPSEWFKGLNLSTTVLPREVDAIRRSIKAVMNLPDPQTGARIGKTKTGIYAFFDYDGEPIYVGQTAESFSSRVGRHLTGQRSDSVAKYVLDPFEVFAIAMWSLPHIHADLPARERKSELNKYEFTIHHLLTEHSKFNAVLNEGDIPECDLMELPDPVGGVIIPDDIFPDRSHPDVRIARRAQTVSLLAKNISERAVSKGLRRTLLTQTRRLVELSERRFEAAGGAIPGIDENDGDVDELNE